MKPCVDSIFIALGKAPLKSGFRDGIKILLTVALTQLLISSVMKFPVHSSKVTGQCLADFPNAADSIQLCHKQETKEDL